MIVIILLLIYVQKQISRFIWRHKIMRCQDTSLNATKSRLNFLEIFFKFDLVLSHFSTNQLIMLIFDFKLSIFISSYFQHNKWFAT